jgi:hypothetical protein
LICLILWSAKALLMEPTGAQNCLRPKGAIPVSAIGDFFREIMPNWLNRPERFRSTGGSFRSRHQRGQDPDDARGLAVEADRIWQQELDDGRHGEAFPDPIAGKQSRSAERRAPAPSKPDETNKPPRSSGSNRPH